MVTFSHSSVRAIKARFARKLSPNLMFLFKLALIVTLGLGTGLVITGVAFGGILISIAISILMVMIWYKGELKELPAKLPLPNTSELILDEALDAQVLGKLPHDPSPKDIWSAVKGHWQQQFFSVRFGLDDTYFEQQVEDPRINSEVVWASALQIARNHGFESVNPGAVVIALFLNTQNYHAMLSALHLEEADLKSGLDWMKHRENTAKEASKKNNFGGLGRDWSAGYTPLLNQVGHNISQDVQNGGLWTRETESHEQVVGQMLQVLSKSTTSSVALVGELGVGKTTAVYALAKKILTEKVPNLRYHQIYSLDASTLIANASKFQSLEQLLLGIFGEASKAGNIIVFLDEAQLFLRAGTGSVDLTNVLLPVLQSGRVHLICALTMKEWQLLSSTNSALAGLLNYQVMPPPSPEDTLEIMQDQLMMIEHKHGVVFTYQSIQEAYRLAEKYIHDQAFPGRGIQVLESTAVLANKGLITPEMVGKSMEAKLGVKVVQASGAESKQLLNLEDELHKRLINQTRAVSVVSNALRRARSGVGNPNRPVGTFLFLGPTGVGKTELAKALADVYFGGRDQVIRLNLNEYSQPQDVSRMLAATTAQSGGNLLLAEIRRQPYSVVLLDEIEKAHPEVLNVLLQLLDEGVIKDTAGSEASFKDAIVIATSNAGADIIRAQIQAGKNLEEFEEALTNKLIDDKAFTPEFLNRFDEIVLFRPLKPEELHQVVSIMINEVNKTLERQKVKVVLTPAALDWLVKNGDDPRLGARPMRRMVQRSVENIVAKKILSGVAGAGSEIDLDVTDLETAPK